MIEVSYCCNAPVSKTNVVCLFVLKWCDPADIQRTLSACGRPNIVCGGFNMRMVRKCVSGQVTWRCTMHTCPARVHTDSDITKIINFVAEHNHLSKKKNSPGSSSDEPSVAVDKENQPAEGQTGSRSTDDTKQQCDATD